MENQNHLLKELIFSKNSENKNGARDIFQVILASITNSLIESGKRRDLANYIIEIFTNSDEVFQSTYLMHDKQMIEIDGDFFNYRIDTTLKTQLASELDISFSGCILGNLPLLIAKIMNLNNPILEAEMNRLHNEYAESKNPVDLYFKLNNILPSYSRIAFFPLSSITDSFIQFSESELLFLFHPKLMTDDGSKSIRAYLEEFRVDCAGGLMDFLVGKKMVQDAVVKSQFSDNSQRALNGIINSIPVLASDWKSNPKKYIWSKTLVTNGHTFRVHLINTRLPPDPKKRAAKIDNFIEAAKQKQKKEKKKSSPVPEEEINPKSVIMGFDEGIVRLICY